LFNSLYLIDFYNIISKLIFLFSSSIVLFLTIFVFNKKKLKFNRYEYPIIIGFANLSCCLLISSFDLILLYLSIECLSFCLYILVLFKIKNKLTAEAGLKYFCLGVVASSSILFGISLIYGAICSTNFMYIKAYLDNCCTSDPLVYTGFIYILSGFFFKLAVFPYHMALIDVYDGSSLSVTTYLVTVVKFVMIIVLCKLLMYVFYSIQGL
jgi:NADH-quinone oxidoreductase subunit N